MSGSGLNLLRRKPDADDAARLDHVQPKLLRGGEDIVRFRARIQPEFIATARRDVRQHLEQHRRREINARQIRAHGNFGDALECRQALDLGFLRIHRVNRVTLPHKCAHGLVPEFAAVC